MNDMPWLSLRRRKGIGYSEIDVGRIDSIEAFEPEAGGMSNSKEWHDTESWKQESIQKNDSIQSISLILRWKQVVLPS